MARENPLECGDAVRELAAMARDMRELGPPRSDRHVRFAFCSTTLGRTWQVQRALPCNMLALWPYRKTGSFRWYLVDFNQDRSELEAWIADRCQGPLRAGLLHYYHCPQQAACAKPCTTDT
ncbi:MAG: hypothetical protein GY772_09465 [bacterium]|nr:hypothetical protein [bacterium]